MEQNKTQPQYPQQPQQHGYASPINPLEAIDFLVTPKAEDNPETEEINRDLVLSNTNPKERDFIYKNMELKQDLDFHFTPEFEYVLNEEGKVLIGEDKEPVIRPTRGTIKMMAFKQMLMKNSWTFSITNRSKGGFERLAQNTMINKNVFRDNTEQKSPFSMGWKKKKEDEQ